MKEHFKLIPSCYLFLISEDKVLLIRRANTGYGDGNWSVPAGHIEGDEPATTAMAREAKEEIGITLDPSTLELVHLTHRRGIDGGAGKENERIALFFLTKTWSGEPINGEPDKCDAVEWFSLKALPQNTIPYIREALEGYQAGKAYSERGW